MCLIKMVVIFNGPGHSGYDPVAERFRFQNEIRQTPETPVPFYKVKFDRMKAMEKFDIASLVEGGPQMDPPARVVVSSASEPQVQQTMTGISTSAATPPPTPSPDSGFYKDFQNIFRAMKAKGLPLLSSTANRIVEGAGEASSEIAQAAENVAQTAAETLSLGIDEIRGVVNAFAQRLRTDQGLLRLGGSVTQFIRNPTVEHERLALDYIERYIVPHIPTNNIPEPLRQIAARVIQQYGNQNRLPLSTILANELAPLLTLPPGSSNPLVIGSSRGTARNQIENLTRQMEQMSLAPSQPPSVGSVGWSIALAILGLYLRTRGQKV